MRDDTNKWDALPQPGIPNIELSLSSIPTESVMAPKLIDAGRSPQTRREKQEPMNQYAGVATEVGNYETARQELLKQIQSGQFRSDIGPKIEYDNAVDLEPPEPGNQYACRGVTPPSKNISPKIETDLCLEENTEPQRELSSTGEPSTLDDVRNDSGVTHDDLYPFSDRYINMREKPLGVDNPDSSYSAHSRIVSHLLNLDVHRRH